MFALVVALGKSRPKTEPLAEDEAIARADESTVKPAVELYGADNLLIGLPYDGNPIM